MRAFTAVPRGRRWRRALPATVPRSWARWLHRPGSLTRALQTLGHVEVRIGLQGIVRLPSRCAAPLTESVTPANESVRVVAGDASCWVRDITLTVDGEAVIAARSVVSVRGSRTAWKSIRTLQARPLACLLYHDPAVTRSVFSYGFFSLVETPFVDRNVVDVCSAIGNAWARSSVFYRRDAPLVLTEIFLPKLWVLIDQRTERHL
jgi:chorismate--pyruvate lyase